MLFGVHEDVRRPLQAGQVTHGVVRGFAHLDSGGKRPLEFHQSLLDLFSRRAPNRT